MSKLEIKGNWDIIKDKLKQRYSNLTDEDLHYEKGQEEELFGRILRRTGQTRLQLGHVLEKSAAFPRFPSPTESTPH